MTAEAWFLRGVGGGGGTNKHTFAEWSFGGSNSLKAYFGDGGSSCPLVGTIWPYSKTQRANNSR